VGVEVLERVERPAEVEARRLAVRLLRGDRRDDPPSEVDEPAAGGQERLVVEVEGGVRLACVHHGVVDDHLPDCPLGELERFAVDVALDLGQDRRRHAEVPAVVDLERFGRRGESGDERHRHDGRESRRGTLQHGATLCPFQSVVKRADAIRGPLSEIAETLVWLSGSSEATRVNFAL
jgi:hypothetical protein